MRQQLHDRLLSQGVERWLVPALLIVVAFIQIGLARGGTLSPWKGGGFGMFAAVDAPTMRVLVAEGFDDRGRAFLFDPLATLDVGTERRLRSVPRRSQLVSLAPQFIGQDFVPVSARSQSIIDAFRAENPATDWPQGDRLAGEDRWYRLKSSWDPDTVATRTLVGLRLQWWRLRFDAKTRRLLTEPIGSVVETGVRS